jgi:hypothetical protein
MVIPAGVKPVTKGDPTTGVKAPVVWLIKNAEMKLEPWFVT